MPKESTLQKITPEELPALIRGLKKQQINELALVGPDFWLAESPENWPNELQGRRVFRLTIRPERLPDELTQHQKWEALILRGLGLRDEDAEILSNHFKNLTRLDLRDNQIGTAGVTAIVQLQNLQTLWLGKNQISELPEVIGQLKNLQSLGFHSSQISELPEVIGQLKNLQSLSLGNNQFSELPEVIGQLKNLRELWLDNNQISELPEVIGQLKNLQSLSL
ncbi:MAG TPA: leucine-rich repeat domain-containing protein, partial [Calditrichia bacterium]|nr:leucine-rich repeat domain-containing protein [Calditrichia bacterium]